MKTKLLASFLILSMGNILIQCTNNPSDSENSPQTKTNDFLVDSLATPQTVALFCNLQTLTKDKFLFGHQETTAYGVGWVNDGFGNRSDVKDVCGDFPAVYGWDIGNIGHTTNLDGVPFSQIKLLMKQAFSRGGVNTISIHLDNPVTDGNAWDVSTAVARILPDSSHHKSFVKTLVLIAEFLKDLKTEDGTFVPVILRPFHEHNGDWFWWGRGPASEQEFIALWQFTVDYFKNEKNVHNVLYAISPDRSRVIQPADPGEYLYGYPGNNYVDIIGLDNYFDLGSHWNQAPVQEQMQSLIKSLETVVRLAEERNKISALTETGLDKLQIADWWTNRLLAGINANEFTRGIAYALVWRNANTGHFHAPYPGQASAADFVTFYNDSITVFESDLPEMYKTDSE
ncbi:MAG: beta-mannosidase [Deferribacteres bacterium]|nr:beta-mannosidase [candidate division KSB1 bacterium]MCB9502167.1 beta-mannosidase [Deferribacteres bacterium]